MITMTRECRALRRARDILGGETELAHFFRVPSSDLLAWLDGTKPVPRSYFLRAVDVILDHCACLDYLVARSAAAEQPADYADLQRTS